MTNEWTVLGAVIILGPITAHDKCDGCLESEGVC